MYNVIKYNSGRARAETLKEQFGETKRQGLGGFSRAKRFLHGKTFKKQVPLERNFWPFS